jgi:hypothetical protein
MRNAELKLTILSMVTECYMFKVMIKFVGCSNNYVTSFAINYSFLFLKKAPPVFVISDGPCASQQTTYIVRNFFIVKQNAV